jgi:hypothetical protein
MYIKSKKYECATCNKPGADITSICELNEQRGFVGSQLPLYRERRRVYSIRNGGILAYTLGPCIDENYWQCGMGNLRYQLRTHPLLIGRAKLKW